MRGAHAAREQVLVDGVVTRALVRCAAGQPGQLLAHQALLVETVAQAFLGQGRVAGELVEQEVAAGPLILFGELRARFEQVVA